MAPGRAFLLGALALQALGAQVCLYEHPDYEGAFNCYTADSSWIGLTWNDRVSSITVSESTEVTVYEHITYGGASLTFDQDVPDLSIFGFDNKLSSMKVGTTDDMHQAVCFYYHLNYLGAKFCANPGTFNSMPSGWNDHITSLKLAPGYKVQLYADSNLGGSTLSVSASNANLVPSSFNDVISSFVVSLITNPCTSSQNCDLFPDVTSVSVTDMNGKPPRKGQDLRVTMRLSNSASQSGMVKVTPYLTSSRFNDYANVQLTAKYVSIGAGATIDVSVKVDTFILDGSTKKRFAVGRGNYEINRVVVESARGNTASDSTFTGKSFTVSASNAVLPIVLFDAGYLSGITGGYSKKPSTYIKEVFTRPSEVYHPSTSTYDSHARGFDQMMDVQHLSSPVPGLSINTESGTCEQATAYATTVLGLATDWKGNVGTNLNHHGFDYIISMSPDQGGGVACGWINVQVSGYINRDLNRQQIILAHESGHLFGSPHCDLTAPSSQYVMCSGERHPHYINDEIFVWFDGSRNLMSNRFD
ncbi:hypothetical protein DIPPA_00712 [Diplonema papillatum]|nr:hypothetical protein DIPPA_00712 [Diplonema papillatum]